MPILGKMFLFFCHTILSTSCLRTWPPKAGSTAGAWLSAASKPSSLVPAGRITEGVGEGSLPRISDSEGLGGAKSVHYKHRPWNHCSKPLIFQDVQVGTSIGQMPLDHAQLKRRSNKQVPGTASILKTCWHQLLLERFLP